MVAIGVDRSPVAPFASMRGVRLVPVLWMKVICNGRLPTVAGV